MDASFSWAINYLFHFDFKTLSQIYCTYGPLGFLKKPVAIGNNFIIAILLFSVLKIFLINLLTFEFFNVKKWHNILPIILIALVTNLDTTFILSATLCFSIFYKRNNWLFLAIGGIISLIALFIKPSFGFASIGVGLFCLIAILNQNKDFKKVLYSIGLSILICLLVSFVIFKDAFYFISFLSNTLFITRGYSASLSLFPNNNWLLITTFIGCVLLIPIFVKDKEIKLFYFFLIPPLFIAWKYAMVREDYSHYNYLIDFAFLLFGMLFLVAKKYDKLKIGVLSLFAISSLILNAYNIEGYNNNYSIKMHGIKNIKPWLISFSEHENSFKNISANNIEVKKLPTVIKNEIDTNAIDVFPWELTYIASNQLNWKPRKSLMSLHMSGYHESISAKDINFNNGPEYVLFHWKKDSMNGNFGSIDYRHLYNDSPTIIYNLLKDYSLSIYDKKVGLFKKNKIKNLKEPIRLFDEEKSVNEWIDVPEKKGIVRLKLEVDYNILGNLKSLTYKGEAFYIEYLMVTNETRKYRFIPSIAENGLWVSPLFKSVEDDFDLSEVKKIRISTSNDKMIKSIIKLKWELIEINNPLDGVNGLFSNAKKI